MTRDAAHILLDAVRDGLFKANAKQVRDALIATGDLPKPFRQIEAALASELPRLPSSFRAEWTA